MFIEVGSKIGLLALLALVPLILLYLIRPRPKHINVPSLMFFARYSGKSKMSSFLRRILQDWLFILHLIIIFLLAASIAKPYTNYMYDITSKNTVIVVDVSASMQAKEGSDTRFEMAISKAKKSLGSKNTVILSKEIPLIGIRDATANDAIDYLHSMKPKDTASRIGDAIILAGETLSGGEGRVVVLSDFINTAGQDPEIAKGILESKGLIVDFINVAGKEVSNIGIIDMFADEKQATVYVKNYDDKDNAVTLNVGDIEKEMNLAPKSIESYSFETPEGVTKITIDSKDSFEVDDQAFLSAPQGGKIKALLITSTESIYLKNALIASGIVDLEIAKPPVVPTTGYDVYIIQDLIADDLLPGTFDELKSSVSSGASLILHMQDDSDQLNYEGILPYKITGKNGYPDFIKIDQLNKFTKNVEFGTINDFFMTSQNADFATVVSAKNSSMVSVGPMGAGKIVYYGILESTSDFRFSPSYPIFWTELFRFITDQQEIRTLNYKTGETLILDEKQEVETPEGKITAPSIMLEDAGIYKFGDRVIAVNLLNERESDISSKEQVGAKSVEFELRPVKEKREFHFENIMLLIAAILLMLELLLIKLRGDI